ncbi:hypothetical protein ASG35_12240 [Burkholderia sp. Leaf177]|uniref:hypothetical protein n=1 Tax=Burkholderia sp. Leaf177 TaxID=1736287 RepID=UPI0006F1F75A|nr:hypothetical protein [Burkholderia sp. Leaf177]KQR77036.1 hypothetical protein ASG35_12240 [Burkholderia sp. Leaf177]
MSRDEQGKNGDHTKSCGKAPRTRLHREREYPKIVVMSMPAAMKNKSVPRKFISGAARPYSSIATKGTATKNDITDNDVLLIALCNVEFADKPFLAR